jgi:hypothetical protein
MTAASIPKHESGFRQSGVDSSGKHHALSPFSVTIPGTGEKMRVVYYRPTQKWDIGPAFDWERVMSAVAPG